MSLYVAILLFNATGSMDRGLSVHLATLMISKGKERQRGEVGTMESSGGRGRRKTGPSGLTHLFCLINSLPM